MADVIEPTAVWTREEWKEQQPWGGMPQGDLRKFFKEEAFIHIYSGGPDKFSEAYARYDADQTMRLFDRYA